MSEPFIGEIRMFGGNFAPRGWAFCNGQLLPIAQNQALFALLGTTYGGNGQTTFALPNLQGRMAMHAGQGPGLSPRDLGAVLGEPAHTLLSSEMPAHTHQLRGAGSASTGTPSAAVALGTGPRVYRSAPANTVAMATPSTATGGSQPHENRSPYLAVSFIIALQGIFRRATEVTAMHEPLLRPVQASDRDFLLQLYLGCRADEGRRAGLPEALWQGLLRQQFAIREQQYGAAYPRAEDRLVLGEAGQAIGRFYVDRSDGALLQLIDIALLPAHQGQGLGRALLLGLQREAAAGEQTIELHVASDNPAARIYESLGFVDMAEPAGRSDHPYRRLRWRAACTV